MANENTNVNYRYGISGAKIACKQSGGTYETPWAERGMESVTESRADATSTTFHSDNGNPQTVKGAGGNDTLSVTAAEFSNDFKTKVKGHRIDSTTGAVVKGHDDVDVTFAFGYQIEGTQKGTKVWKFGCTSSEPAAAAHQTNADGVTEAPETATFTVGGDYLGGEEVYEMVCHKGDPGYDTFLDAVPTTITTGE